VKVTSNFEWKFDLMLHRTDHELAGNLTLYLDHYFEQLNGTSDQIPMEMIMNLQVTFTYLYLCFQC
jgi:hypothetical protein